MHNWLLYSLFGIPTEKPIVIQLTVNRIIQTIVTAKKFLHADAPTTFAMKYVELRKRKKIITRILPHNNLSNPVTKKC